MVAMLETPEMEVMVVKVATEETAVMPKVAAYILAVALLS